MTADQTPEAPGLPDADGKQKLPVSPATFMNFTLGYKAFDTSECFHCRLFVCAYSFFLEVGEADLPARCKHLCQPHEALIRPNACFALTYASAFVDARAATNCQAVCADVFSVVDSTPPTIYGTRPTIQGSRPSVTRAFTDAPSLVTLW